MKVCRFPAIAEELGVETTEEVRLLVTTTEEDLIAEEDDLIGEAVVAGRTTELEIGLEADDDATRLEELEAGRRLEEVVEEDFGMLTLTEVEDRTVEVLWAAEDARALALEDAMGAAEEALLNVSLPSPLGQSGKGWE